MNIALTIITWILLSALTIYAAVVCVGVFKEHYLNANRTLKKHCCRVWTALAVTLPVLSVLKTIQLMFMIASVG